jgi:hypothetical protein
LSCFDYFSGSLLSVLPVIQCALLLEDCEELVFRLRFSSDIIISGTHTSEKISGFHVGSLLIWNLFLRDGTVQTEPVLLRKLFPCKLHREQSKDLRYRQSEVKSTLLTPFISCDILLNACMLNFWYTTSCHLSYAVNYYTFRFSGYLICFDIRNVIFRGICFYVINLTLSQVCLWLYILTLSQSLVCNVKI